MAAAQDFINLVDDENIDDEIIDLLNVQQVVDKPLPPHLEPHLKPWKELQPTHINHDDSMCPVCLNELSDFKFVLQLTCGHTFCRDCYQSHKDTKETAGIIPLCPMCNHIM